MKSIIIRGIIVLFPILLILVGTNCIVDPAHLYSSKYIDRMILGIKDGYNIEGRSNLNERLYKLKLSELNKGKNYDYLALGASRVMTLSEDAFIGKSLLNLGVSGAKIEDMMALVQICEDNQIVYDNVIIAVEPSLFNENDNDSRWKSLQFYYNKFNGKKTGHDIDWSKIKNLFSIAYFQASISSLPNLISGKNELKYVSSFDNDGFTNRTDGSIYYDKKYRDVSQTEVDKRAESKLHSSYKGFKSLSQERIELFEGLIQYFNSKGIKVIFFECPFHPIYYKNVLDVIGAVEGIYYINGISKKNNIIVIGNYDPNEVEFTSADFYDGGHAKKESIDTLFHAFSFP